MKRLLPHVLSQHVSGFSMFPCMAPSRSRGHARLPWAPVVYGRQCRSVQFRSVDCSTVEIDSSSHPGDTPVPRHRSTFAPSMAAECDDGYRAAFASGKHPLSQRRREQSARVFGHRGTRRTPLRSTRSSAGPWGFTSSSFPHGSWRRDGSCCSRRSFAPSRPCSSAGRDGCGGATRRFSYSADRTVFLHLTEDP
jgi:hypothetical protein